MSSASSVPSFRVMDRRSRQLTLVLTCRRFRGGRQGVWPRQKRHRRHLAEAVMGSLGVVNLEPRLGDLAHLLEGVKEVGVEDLFAETPIEPLDEGVLIGFPRLDVADGN